MVLVLDMQKLDVLALDIRIGCFFQQSVSSRLVGASIVRRNFARIYQDVQGLKSLFELLLNTLIRLAVRGSINALITTHDIEKKLGAFKTSMQ